MTTTAPPVRSRAARALIGNTPMIPLRFDAGRYFSTTLFPES